MPSFYPRQPAGLPLTPPEYQYYNMGPIGSFRPLKGVFDYQNEFHPNFFPEQIHQNVQQHYHRLSYQQQQQQQHQKFYEAPVTLPAIKVDEDKKKKEDKPVGGVSAVLDYEIADMAEFVSSVASGMYATNDQSFSFFSTDINRMMSGSSPAFKKFVLQILTSTRLPSSTILLGLEYLSDRVKMIGGPKFNQIYKTLTVALLLASKFLDDNTFQNRSWAEVTGISIAEVNSLEAEWLQAIDWRLHHDPEQAKGFKAWRSSWHSFLSAKQKPLAPIDTSNVRQYSPIFPRDNRPYYSPPESGPATPEWNFGMNWNYYRPSFHQWGQCACHGCTYQQQNIFYSYGQTVA